MTADVKHEPIPTTALRRLESFAKCAICGRTVTRINGVGKISKKWTHLP